MDALTKNISRYVREKGINVSKMARDTGLSYMALYDSLLNDERNREIRGKELIAICKFLDINPMDFADDSNGKQPAVPTT